MAASDTTYADIQSLLPDVYDAAMMYAQQNFFMPSLVTVYTDMTGMQARKGSKYAAGTVVTGLGETDDLDTHTQEFARSAAFTLTPGEIGTQFFITDQRIESDDSEVLADLSQHIGYTVFKQVEDDLLGNFSTFTGGTIGTAGGTLSWGDVYDAVAILRATGVPAPYFAVLHEYHYRRLAQAANIAGLANPAPLDLRDGIQSNYLVQNIGGNAFLYTSGVPAAGTAVVGAVFSRAALAYDVRRGLRIEPQRDASRRGVEVNATHIYAHGLRRSAWGVTLIGDASSPAGT
jgi:hypothetical protein